MYREKSTKIKCFISILIATNLWIFIWFQFQLDVTIDNHTQIFYTTFLFPIILHILAVTLAANAVITSTKQITRKGCIVCLVYSILSLILFLIISRFIMSK